MDKISVIIPCYNNELYIGRSIESVLSQDYPNIEVIVVDDGSTDNSKEVIHNYAVKYIYQENRGCSYARNVGANYSTGKYLVFLDADDWLLDNALNINVAYLMENEEAAFVAGSYQFFYQSRNVFDDRLISLHKDPYLGLLNINFIGMIATVMFRKNIFDDFKFNDKLKVCEDYDLFLRICRNYEVICHQELIAVYRIYGDNTSSNIPRMLNGCLKVLNNQESFLKSDLEKKYFTEGFKTWTDYYTELIFHNNFTNINNANIISWESFTLYKYNKELFQKFIDLRTQRIQSMINKIKYYSNIRNILSKVRRRLVSKLFVEKQSEEIQINEFPEVGHIKKGDFDRTTPFSVEFGYDRGGPIDRYYIENFLDKESSTISGVVLEIGDNEYTMRFGGDKVLKSEILHVNDHPNATIIGDLSNAPQIPSNYFDCIILTQTLHLVFDYDAVIETCYRILKPGGSLLLTVPGIAPIDYGSWGYSWYWSFNSLSIKLMLEKHFLPSNTVIESFGNVQVASSFLYGLGLPEMEKEVLDYNDHHMQVIVTAKVTK